MEHRRRPQPDVPSFRSQFSDDDLRRMEVRFMSAARRMKEAADLNCKASVAEQLEDVRRTGLRGERVVWLDSDGKLI